MVEIRNKWQDKKYLDLGDYAEISEAFKEEIENTIDGNQELLEKTEEQLEEKQAEIDDLKMEIEELKLRIEELECELNG